MTDTSWQIIGRSAAGPVADNWREQLATRLGYRPRRIGLLAELALYGALQCLDDAHEAVLSAEVALRVCSLRGADTAIQQVLEQGRSELPMPFTFLQSQTSQLLPALASALNWQGDACAMVVRDPLAMATMACHQSGRAGLLLGWVEEQPQQSDWLRLAPCDVPAATFTPATDFASLTDVNTRYWKLGKAGLLITSA